MTKVIAIFPMFFVGTSVVAPPVGKTINDLASAHIGYQAQPFITGPAQGTLDAIDGQHLSYQAQPFIFYIKPTLI